MGVKADREFLLGWALQFVEYGDSAGTAEKIEAEENKPIPSIITKNWIAEFCVQFLIVNLVRTSKKMLSDAFTQQW